MQVIIRSFLAASCLLLWTGCSYSDPATNQQVAPTRAFKWTPSKLVETPSCEPHCLAAVDSSHVLTPDELLDIALRNNPQTGQSWHSARAAAYNVTVSQAPYYPLVTLTETGALFHVSGAGAGSSSSPVPTSGSGSNRELQSSLSLSYLLLDFGGRSATVESARQALAAANWAHNRTVQTVMISVLTAYYNYAYAIGLVDARQQDLHDLADDLDAARHQLEAGVGTKVDLLQAQANWVNGQLQLQSAEGLRDTALGQLALALGWPANAQFNVVAPPQQLPVDAVSEDVNTLVERAKRERPDLASAYSAVLQARSAVDVAKSAAWPTLGLGGQLARTDFSKGGSLNGQSQGVALSLSIPIFTGFLDKYQVAAAREVEEQTYAAWQTAEANALMDVVTAYYNYKTAVQNMGYTKQYLDYAQEAYNAALLSYKMGTDSLIDLLNAQETLSDARAQYVQSRTQFFTAVATISYAVGTL